MMVQKCVGWRLEQNIRYNVNELMDMINAFGCIQTDSMIESAAEIFGTNDQALINNRLVNSIVHIKAVDGENTYLPQQGGLI